MDVAAMAGKLSSLKLCEKAAISLEKVKKAEYVLDIDSQKCSQLNNDAKVAATSSNFSVRLYSRHNLATTGQVKAHEKPLTGVRFSPSDPNLFFTSSLDGSIKSWDMRDLKSPCLTYEGYAETTKVFCSFDVNCDGLVLCAGTEANKAGDSYLIFWDLRTADKVGVYSDAHLGDVTQVKFHPSNRDRLISCSTDGLVNLYDLSQNKEDDAILTTFNTESSAGTIGWCGEEYENVYCCSHIETFHMWETVTEEFETLTTIPDLRDKYEGAKKFDYLVDCFQPKSSRHPYLLTGSNTGKAQIWSVQANELKFVSSLIGGHNNAVIRCATWDDEVGNLVTGGEDSMLCSWSSKSTELVLEKGRSTNGEMKMKKTNFKHKKGKMYEKR